MNKEEAKQKLHDLAFPIVKFAHKVTEAEAKEKYPNFKWVSLGSYKYTKQR